MEVLAKFMGLIGKKKKNSTDMKSMVLMLRNHELGLSDVTVEYAIELIKKNKRSLGSDYYIYLEELFFAGLDCQIYTISDNAFKILNKKFPQSDKIKRMKGILQEAIGYTEKAEDYYKELIEANLADTISRKRKISILRSEDKKKEAVDELNQYLEENMQDSEAWLELADIYLESLNFQKALFCYDELVILNPKNIHYLVKLAEIYYTLGGLANLQTAKSYYSFILSKNMNNYRALWGLYQVLKTLVSIKKSEEKDVELMELTGLSIKAFYEKKGTGNLIKNMALTN